MKLKALVLGAIITVTASTIAQNTFPLNGNVGIGITNPQYALEVNYIAKFNSTYAVSGNFGHYLQNNYTNADLNVFGNFGNGTLPIFKAGAISGGAYLDIFKVQNHGTVEIKKLFKNHPFIVRNNDDAEFFKINEFGNTIIRAVQGNNHLTIKENLTGQDVFVVNRNGKLKIQALNHDAHFTISHENGTELHNISKDGAVLIRTQNNAQPFSVKNTANNSIFQISHTGTVSIHSSGNKSLIVRNSIGEKTLQLNDDGLLRTREVKVDQDNWPDFVFKNTYSIMPLTEVENYINANKHLPNIPSATEIETNGLSIGKMQNLHMQKIEELTIYAIEQNKDLTDLQNENTLLKSELEQLKRDLEEIKALLIKK